MNLFFWHTCSLSNNPAFHIRLKGSRSFLCLRRFGCDGLVIEIISLVQEIKLYDCYQNQAAKQIRSQYITGPVFTQINARDTDEDDRDSKDHQQQTAFQRWLQQAENQESNKTQKSKIVHDVPARET